MRTYTAKSGGGAAGQHSCTPAPPTLRQHLAPSSLWQAAEHGALPFYIWRTDTTEAKASDRESDSHTLTLNQQRRVRV